MSVILAVRSLKQEDLEFKATNMSHIARLDPVWKTTEIFVYVCSVYMQPFQVIVFSLLHLCNLVLGLTFPLFAASQMGYNFQTISVCELLGFLYVLKKMMPLCHGIPEHWGSNILCLYNDSDFKIVLVLFTINCLFSFRKDIIDTGKTMQTLLSLVKQYNPKMVKVARYVWHFKVEYFLHLEHWVVTSL